MNLLNAIVAMYNKINELTNIINNIWQYELNEYKTDKQIAILGNKGANLNIKIQSFKRKKFQN